MAFNVCEHKIRILAIKMAKLLREAKGLPDETNITVLYDWVAPLLGLTTDRLNSKDTNHLPIPGEIVDLSGKLIFPGKDCPKCGSKVSVFPTSVCANCEDWKNGFRSSWTCFTKGCGYKELLKIPYTQLLDEVAPGWKGGFKTDLGIKTITDEGIK